MFFVRMTHLIFFFFFKAEDGIRDTSVTGVQTCALPISIAGGGKRSDGEQRGECRSSEPACKLVLHGCCLLVGHVLGSYPSVSLGESAVCLVLSRDNHA